MVVTTAVFVMREMKMTALTTVMMMKTMTVTLVFMKTMGCALWLLDKMRPI